ncbi:DUF7225 domain-containing protein [Exiguobacterium artemiae]
MIMIKRISIYDQLKSILKHRKEEIITPNEIKEELFHKYGTNKDSVILSDYCYNRSNRGIAFNKHLFVYLNHGMYKYIGEHANYSGLIYARTRASSKDQVVGLWKDGQMSLSVQPSSVALENQESLENNYIIELFEEYMDILRFEMNVLGCEATELRHLIGRLGEFYCAIHTKGKLAHVTNQHGFDVTSNGRRISVKTTAQKTGFVSLNIRTLEQFDDIFIVQFLKNEFHLLFYASKDQLPKGRIYNQRLEIDISSLKKKQLL